VLDVGQRLGAEALVGLLTEAVRLRLTTLERLQHALIGRRRVRHRALFADLLDDLIGVESTLEYVYRRDVERLHGLPKGQRQVSLSVGTAVMSSTTTRPSSSNSTVALDMWMAMRPSAISVETTRMRSGTS
jgi:hypothetical protein